VNKTITKFAPHVFALALCRPLSRDFGWIDVAESRVLLSSAALLLAGGCLEKGFERLKHHRPGSCAPPVSARILPRPTNCLAASRKIVTLGPVPGLPLFGFFILREYCHTAVIDSQPAWCIRASGAGTSRNRAARDLRETSVFHEESLRGWRKTPGAALDAELTLRFFFVGNVTAGPAVI